MAPESNIFPANVDIVPLIAIERNTFLLSEKIIVPSLRHKIPLGDILADIARIPSSKLSTPSSVSFPATRDKSPVVDEIRFISKLPSVKTISLFGQTQSEYGSIFD